MIRLIALCMTFMTCGCDLWQSQFTAGKDSTALVPGDPFGAPPPGAPTQSGFAPASGDVAWRVDYLGRKLVAANAHVGVKPLFATIGAPKEEIFHQGQRIVYVTEGLVNQCKSEGELAAVLAHELGKLIAEREANARVQRPEKLPPISMPIGHAGSQSAADQTHLAELARFEKENPRRVQEVPRPDPQGLARGFLEKAGYQATDLDAVLPLLQTAERNYALEKQLRSSQLQPKWNP